MPDIHTMTMRQAILQAQRDLAWHVTPNSNVTATVRYLGFDGSRRTTELTLTETDKADELVHAWADRHDELGAAFDSVLFVETPKPITTFFQ